MDRVQRVGESWHVALGGAHHVGARLERQHRRLLPAVGVCKAIRPRAANPVQGCRHRGQWAKWFAVGRAPQGRMKDAGYLGLATLLTLPPQPLPQPAPTSSRRCHLPVQSVRTKPLKPMSRRSVPSSSGLLTHEGAPLTARRGSGLTSRAEGSRLQSHGQDCYSNCTHGGCCVAHTRLGQTRSLVLASPPLYEHIIASELAFTQACSARRGCQRASERSGIRSTLPRWRAPLASQLTHHPSLLTSKGGRNVSRMSSALSLASKL